MVRHLDTIERIAVYAAQRSALDEDATEEFVSLVKLKLIEDDYAAIRGFEGRSTLTTYLTAVILNLARDYRFHQYGRWRPSAAAERLGTTAIRLERMMARDGLSLHEASAALRAHHRSRRSTAELAELAAMLPSRHARRFIGSIPLDALPSQASAEVRLERREASATLDRTTAVLNDALAALPAEDRLILRMRFVDGLKVSVIARALGLEQPRLYPRLRRLLRELQCAIESAGLDRRAVLTAFTHHPGGELGLRFDPLPEVACESPSTGRATLPA